MTKVKFDSLGDKNFVRIPRICSLAFADLFGFPACFAFFAVVPLCLGLFFRLVDLGTGVTQLSHEWLIGAAIVNGLSVAR